MQPNEHLPQQFWLTNQDGTYYQFLATLEHHDPKTAVLVVESVKSEALCKGAGKAEPRPQNLRVTWTLLRRPTKEPCPNRTHRACDLTTRLKSR